MANYAVAILTHGRPNNQLTLETLRKQGWTRDVYLVLDDMDDTIEQYHKNYDSDPLVHIIVFDKLDILSRVDTGLTNPKLASDLYVRNAMEEIFPNMGFDAWIECDDDIKSFNYRYKLDGQLKNLLIHDLDKIFDLSIEYMLNSDITTFGFLAAFHFIGGVDYDKHTDGFKYRHCVSFYMRNASKPVKWVMNFLADDITCSMIAKNGGVVLAHKNIQTICNESFGAVEGGMAALYLDKDTPPDAMFILTVFPSSIDIGVHHNRLVANKRYNNLMPKIISSKFKI